MVDFISRLAGAILFVSAFAAFLAWIFKLIAGKKVKDAFPKSFAVCFMVIALWSMFGSLTSFSEGKIEFSTWLEKEATQEERNMAYKIKQKMTVSSLDDDEVSSFLGLFLNYLEFRGVSKEELKSNPDDSIRIVKNMYGSILEYQYAVVQSMLQSWDNNQLTYTDNLDSLVTEVKKINSWYEYQVQVDTKMIELAARREENFFLPESMRFMFESDSWSPTVSPMQVAGEDNLYELNREIIAARLKEIEQAQNNIDSLLDQFERWLMN